MFLTFDVPPLTGRQGLCDIDSLVQKNLEKITQNGKFSHSTYDLFYSAVPGLLLFSTIYS